MAGHFALFRMYRERIIFSLLGISITVLDVIGIFEFNYLLFIFIIALFFVQEAYSYTLFILTMLFMPDRQFLIENNDLNFHFMGLGGVGLSVLCVIFYCCVFLFRFLSKGIFKVFPIVVFLIYLIFASLLVSIINGNIYYGREIIADLRYPLNFIVGYIIMDRLLSYGSRDIPFYILLALLVNGLRLIFFGLIVASNGLLYGLIGTSLMYAMPLLFLVKLKGSVGKALSIVFILVFSILVYVVSPSRGKLFGYIFIFLPLIKIGLTKRFLGYLSMIFLVVLIGGGFGLKFLVNSFGESSLSYLTWKLSSFRPEAGNESASVRSIEFKNIFALMYDEPHRLFVGDGLGGNWNSKNVSYGFELIGTDSYPIEWIRDDIFFKPHGQIQYYLLKYGLIASIILYLLISSRLSYISPNHRILSGFILFLSLVCFTSLLQLLLGLLLRLISERDIRVSTLIY